MFNIQPIQNQIIKILNPAEIPHIGDVEKLNVRDKRLNNHSEIESTSFHKFPNTLREENQLLMIF